jgi:hypothetical protein
MVSDRPKLDRIRPNCGGQALTEHGNFLTIAKEKTIWESQAVNASDAIPNAVRIA